jgi:hypothetical protein
LGMKVPGGGGEGRWRQRCGLSAPQSWRLARLGRGWGDRPPAGWPRPAQEAPARWCWWGRVAPVNTCTRDGHSFIDWGFCHSLLSRNG